MTKPLALIVEDNHTLSEIYEIACSEAGYQTECIFDGQEALEVLDKIRPDLLILDLHLPLVSGEDVLKGSRQSQGLKDLQVIVVSADGRLTVDEDIRGMADFVMQKPVSMKQLSHIARRLAPTT